MSETVNVVRARQPICWTGTDLSGLKQFSSSYTTDAASDTPRVFAIVQLCGLKQNVQCGCWRDPVMPMGVTLADVVEQLDEIEQFEPGWDGHGADPIPSAVVERARRLVHRLAAIPFVSATACRSIQMEYEDEAHGYVEYDVTDGTAIQRAWKKPDGSWDLQQLDEDGVVHEIRKFYAW